MTNEWTDPNHAEAYLARMEEIPHRVEGEATLLSEIPTSTQRVLDLGCGNGHLLSLVLARCPDATGVGLDFSPKMLDEARNRFAAEDRVEVIEHNMDETLPECGRFDAIVSSFAIHHCTDERKRALYAEAFQRLQPGGFFANLEHVSSPTVSIHERFVDAMGMTAADEDPSNKLLDVETQLRWLREIGYEDVDCFWKWRELALLAGRRPRVDSGAIAAGMDQLAIDDAPSAAEVHWLGQQLEQYNLDQVRVDDEQSLHLVIRENDQVIAGMKALTGWDWLYVQLLWVSDRHRQQGLGSRLLGHAEQVARSRGCLGSCLSSFSFQAPEFYLRHGYNSFGQIDHYPGEHVMYFYSKHFQDTNSQERM